MKLHPLAFLCLNRELIDFIYLEYFTPDQKTKIQKPHNTPSFWEETITYQDKDITVYKFVFQFHTTDEHYFYKKQSIDPLSSKEISIKNPIIINAVKILGIKAPKEIADIYPDKHEVIAPVVFQLFLEKYAEKFYLENQVRYKVYDKEEGKLILRSDRKKEIKSRNFDTIPEGERILKSTAIETNLIDKDTHKYSIYKLLTRFFSMLTKGEFISSINFWEIKLREELWGNISEYKIKHEIENLQKFEIFKIELVQDTSSEIWLAEAFVYYEISGCNWIYHTLQREHLEAIDKLDNSATIKRLYNQLPLANTPNIYPIINRILLVYRDNDWFIIDKFYVETGQLIDDHLFRHPTLENFFRQMNFKTFNQFRVNLIPEKKEDNFIEKFLNMFTKKSFW